MRIIPAALALAMVYMLAPAPTGFGSGEAFAQATCRNKCNDKEQACLKRTNNKGQCGRKAKTCHSKCR